MAFIDLQVAAYRDGVLTWKDNAKIAWMTDGSTPYVAGVSNSSAIISDRQLVSHACDPDLRQLPKSSAFWRSATCPRE